jgi:hypothetical protein
MIRKVLKKAAKGIQQEDPKKKIENYKKINEDIKNSFKNKLVKSITNKAHTDSMNKMYPNPIFINPSLIKNKKGGIVKTKSKKK